MKVDHVFPMYSIRGDLVPTIHEHSFRVLGNFKRKWEALAVQAENKNAEVVDYLYGLYPRGWVVYVKEFPDRR